MAKSFEKRLAYLEKLITDFFSTAQGTAKRTANKSGRARKRKAKTARKAIVNKVKGRKATKRRRSA